MNVRTLQRHWDEFARTNPFAAILTDRRRPRWDTAEFFATGEADVKAMFSRLHDLKLDCRRRRALDFGCGVGRVTQALATRFETVLGLDVSPEMIRLAGVYNTHHPGCTFSVNASEGLDVQNDTFDFVYSRLVLQHIEPRLALNYVREFVRVLAPGGLLVFQVPTPAPRGEVPPTGWKRRLPMFLVRTFRTIRGARSRPFPYMAMHGVAVAEVAEVVAAARGSLLHTLRDASHGDEWPGFLYIVKKT